MKLAPGPIPKLAEGTIPDQLEDPGFGALVNQELAGLPVLEAWMDALVDPDILIFPDLPDSGLGPSLDELDASVQAAAVDQPQDSIDYVNTHQQLGSEAIIATFEATPGEAFQPVPDAMTIPGEDGGSPVSNPLSVTLSNVTRPGALDFHPGETYRIDCEVSKQVGGGGEYAGVEITMYPWIDESPIPPMDWGATDQFGFLSVQGSFTSDQAGQWGATFYTTTPEGAQMAGPTLNWAVTAGERAAPVRAPRSPGSGSFIPPRVVRGRVMKPTQALHITIANQTRPGDASFLVGDQWTLTARGPAAADVQISALLNGQALPPVILGKTDDTGTFTLDGAMDDAHIGTWSEFYAVGGVNWAGALGFTVSPAIAAAAAAGSGQAVSATLRNLTQASTDFSVGDQWELTISGSPQAPVAASATRDGTPQGVTQFGLTDASGALVLRGEFTADQVGAWAEVWSVAGVEAAPLNFVVKGA